MKLEEEIKQLKGFIDDYHKAFVNIVYTAAWINGNLQRILKIHGISLEQYNVLRILRGQFPTPASVSLIQERMLDKSSNASRLVEKLRQKDLVSREVCETDRRQVDVVITQTGLDLLSVADKDVHMQHECLRVLTEAEVVQFNDMLDRLRTR